LDEAANDLPGAETNEQAALAWLPSSSQDWSELGVIQAKLKKYQNAAQDFLSLQNLAQALKNLRKREEAIQEYRHTLALKPRFGAAWLGLGQTLEEAGNKAEAEKCYQNALRYRVQNALELASLARFCESRGWREAAVTNY